MRRKLLLWKRRGGDDAGNRRRQDMYTVEATETKVKQDRRIIYSFYAGGEIIEAHYHYVKNSTLEFFRNGIRIGMVDRPNEKVQFLVGTETSPITLTACMETGNFFSGFFGKGKGVSIEVDGAPVRFTLADPETHVRNGKSGLYVLLIIFALKSITTLYSGSLVYTPAVMFATAAIYLIPLLIVIISIINFKRWVSFALIAGVVLSILELIDFALGIPGAILLSGRVPLLAIWLLIRVGVLYILFNALKWKRK
jgi:hypothetical protein